MTDVLAEICAVKRRHVAECKAARAPQVVAAAARRRLHDDPPRGFAARLLARRAAGAFGLIAEIKKASPSHGLIRADFDPAALACAYKTGGATCLSVLTDTPYFQGRDADLATVRAAIDLPILRKDFMLDPYQIAESAALGADCVLLILAALDDASARELAAAAAEFGLDILIECHDAEEVRRALRLPQGLIGINNRNLKTLATDLATSETLAGLVPPDRLIVAESGLRHHGDLQRLAQAGIQTFLVGESLMRQADLATATRALLGGEDRDARPMTRAG